MDAARRVRRELLDELPADDPRARRSRRDLVRVNTLMANGRIVARELRRAPEPLRAIAEIGAGDGAFALRVVRGLPRPEAPSVVTLLDRQSLVARDTLQSIARCGWTPRAVAADVFDWLADPATPRFDAIVANLFLHHFEGAALAGLLELIARRTRFFVACEPRRSEFALAGSRLLGLVGCNEVTRHDAVASVHAGFRDGELTELWPRWDSCVMEEGARGLFSHLFVARRL